jgi:hypothetical protein
MPSRSSDRSTKGLIAIAAGAGFAFLVRYFRSFIFPAVPVVLWGDQVGFFADGSRIVSGQLSYRDYFQIVPPGIDLTYALIVKCFGWSGWIPNLTMAFLAAAMAWMIVLIAQRLMVGRFRASSVAIHGLRSLRKFGSHSSLVQYVCGHGRHAGVVGWHKLSASRSVVIGPSGRIPCLPG